MPKKGTGLQLSIDEADKERLENLAAEFGFLRGTKPNITGLVEAIAQKQIPLGAIALYEQVSLPWSEDRIAALLKLVWMLRDAGDYVAVNELAAILLERPELNAPLRAQLELYQSSFATDWQSKIQLLIDAQAPFQLSYADATGEVAIYNIRYATIVQRQRHQYLDAWVESTDNKSDLPELAHNRSFRFDRIASAGIAPLTGEWRKQGLDTVEVEFRLMERLAHAYEPRTNDVSDRWVSNADVPTRVIKRNISNTFWFIREVLPYGKDCVIISPKPVRDRVLDELKAALENYIRC